MNIRFDHLSLSAKDPEGMKDFLVSLLGLTVGHRANLPFAGYFLYAGDQDLVHIFGRDNDSPNDNPSINKSNHNIIHHVSFFSDDYEETMHRIQKLGATFRINEMPDSDVKQIFVYAPENLLIEIQAKSNY